MKGILDLNTARVGSPVASSAYTRDGDKFDTNFQGYVRFPTSSTGEYYFRTIKPVPYRGRPAADRRAGCEVGHRAGIQPRGLSRRRSATGGDGLPSPRQQRSDETDDNPDFAISRPRRGRAAVRPGRRGSSAASDYEFRHDNVLGTSLELCVRAETDEAARLGEARASARSTDSPRFSAATTPRVSSDAGRRPPADR